ncbi:hypothetical protein Bca101_009171 [Brassica carinata]
MHLIPLQSDISTPIKVKPMYFNRGGEIAQILGSKKRQTRWRDFPSPAAQEIK